MDLHGFPIPYIIHRNAHTHFFQTATKRGCNRHYSKGCDQQERLLNFTIIIVHPLHFWLCFQIVSNIPPHQLFFMESPVLVDSMPITTDAVESTRSRRFNRNLSFAFLAIFLSTAFTASFDAAALPTKPYLRWLMSVPCVLAKNILNVEHKKVSKRSANVVSTSMFCLVEYKRLCKLSTEQIHQLLRTALTIHHICIQDSFVEDMFNVIFLDQEFL